MAATLRPDLQIKLGLDKLGLDKGLKGARSDLDGLEKTATKATGTFGKLKGALGSVFGKAAGFASGILLANTIYKITGAIGGLVNASLDFNEQMANVNSVALLGTKGIAKLSDSLLQIAEDPRIQDMPAQLAAGLYTIVSSGYSAADAMLILKAAAISATAGMSTTAVASDLLVSTLGAYGKTAKDATFVSNQLFEIVNVSKYTFDQLAQSLASVTPIASKLGLGIDQIGAAMAAMGRQGVDADTATVELNGILTGLLKPTDAMTAALSAAGYASGEALIKTEGLAGALKFLEAATGGSAAKAAELFGDIRALRGIEFLTGKGAEYYATALDAMGHAQDGAGATAKALAKQMQSARFQLRLLHKNVVLFFTEGIGGKFTKAIAKAVSLVNHLFDSFFRARRRGLGFVAALFTGIRSAILKALGRDTYAKIKPFIDGIEKGFKLIGAVIGWVVRHIGTIIKAWLVFTAVVSGVAIPLLILYAVFKKVIGAVSDAVGMFKKLKEAGFTTVFALQGAFAKLLHAFGLDKLIGPMRSFVAWVAKVVGIGKALLTYLYAVATGTKPFSNALLALPKPLRMLAYVLGRIVKTVRVFFKTWKDEGFFAALKKMSNQMKALGQALGWLVYQITGSAKARAFIEKLFDEIGDAFRHLVYLIDDLVHGRWAKAWKDLGKLAGDGKKILKDAMTGLWAVITAAWNAIDWGKVGDAIWGGLQTAWDWAVITAVPWVAEKLWDLVTTAWGAIDWNAVGDTIWTGTQTAFGFVGQAGDWLLGKGEELIGYVWDAIDWDAVGGTIWTGLQTAFTFGKDAASWLAGKGAELIGYLWNLDWDTVATDIWNGIWTAVQAAGKLGAIGADVGYDLLKSLWNLDWKQVATDVWNGLWTALQMVKTLGNIVLDAVVTLGGDLAAIRDDAATWLKTGLGWTGDKTLDVGKLILQSDVTIVDTSGNKVGGGDKSLVDKIFGGIKSAVEAAPGLFWDALKGGFAVGEKLASLAETAVGLLWDAITFSVGQITADRIKKLGEAFTIVFAAVFALPLVPAVLMQSLVGSIVLGFVSELESSFEDKVGVPLRAWAQGIIDTVKGVLGISSPSTVFAGIGADLASGLVSGISFDGIFNYFWSIGRAITGGLVSGISSLWGDFVAQINALIAKAMEVRTALQVSSPSKFMADTFRNYMQGAIVGIQKGMPAFERAVGGVTTTAMGANGSPSLATRAVVPAASMATGGGSARAFGPVTINNHFPPGVTDPDQLAELSAQKTLNALRRMRAAQA